MSKQLCSSVWQDSLNKQAFLPISGDDLKIINSKKAPNNSELTVAFRWVPTEPRKVLKSCLCDLVQLKSK